MILVDTSVWIDYFKGIETQETNFLDLAIKAAENYRVLRKQGITIRKSADVIIATFCIEKNIPLLFTDRDFLPFTQHLELQVACIQT
jgi:predicted nucleic acid-binding protein